MATKDDELEFPLEEIASINLTKGVVHFRTCEAKVTTFFDLDGEKTMDGENAVSCVVRIPDECPIGAGDWLTIDFRAFGERQLH